MNKLKKVAKCLGIALWVVIMVVGIYVAYVSLQYYRIADNVDLQHDVINPIEGGKKVEIGEEYSIMTYNIGFGAYIQEYTFFMDYGTMEDGTEVVGEYGKALSKEKVLFSTNGSVDAVKELDTDFIFLQEVDKQAHRSYKVNQYQMFVDALKNYQSVYASNFHSAYLFYPLNDPIGKVEAGIVTFSKIYSPSTVRRSFTVDNSFPNKFFDLDRCFMVSRYPLNNSKELVLINLHMSAYDEGGKIRASQLEMLNQVLKEEYEKGNYVIAGGDFNHDITGKTISFPSKQKYPEWVQVLEEKDIDQNYHIVYGTNAPTCRAAEIPYTKGVNFTVIIDGFLVSDNIDVVSVENIDLDFMYSDHNPAKMVFKLRG